MGLKRYCPNRDNSAHQTSENRPSILLTSKGAPAVTGGGFVTLSATLSSLGTIPVSGLTLLLGIDRFVSEARGITNLIGNGVATLVIAHWGKA